MPERETTKPRIDSHVALAATHEVGQEQNRNYSLIEAMRVDTFMTVFGGWTRNSHAMDLLGIANRSIYSNISDAEKIKGKPTETLIVLQETLMQQGYSDFRFIGSGQDRIAFSALSRNGDRVAIGISPGRLVAKRIDSEYVLQAISSGEVSGTGYEVTELLDLNVSYDEKRKFVRDASAAGLVINDDVNYSNVGKDKDGKVLYIDPGVGSIEWGSDPTKVAESLERNLKWIDEAEAKSKKEVGRELSATHDAGRVGSDVDISKVRKQIENCITEFMPEDYGNLPDSKKLSDYETNLEAAQANGDVSNPYRYKCGAFSDAYQLFLREQGINAIRVTSYFHDYLVIPVEGAEPLIFDPTIRQVYNGLEKPYFIGTLTELLALHEDNQNSFKSITRNLDFDKTYFGPNLRIISTLGFTYKPEQVPESLVKMFSGSSTKEDQIAILEGRLPDPEENNPEAMLKRTDLTVGNREYYESDLIRRAAAREKIQQRMFLSDEGFFDEIKDEVPRDTKTDAKDDFSAAHESRTNEDRFAQIDSLLQQSISEVSGFEFAGEDNKAEVQRCLDLIRKIENPLEWLVSEYEEELDREIITVEDLDDVIYPYANAKINENSQAIESELQKLSARLRSYLDSQMDSFSEVFDSPRGSRYYIREDGSYIRVRPARRELEEGEGKGRETLSKQPLVNIGDKLLFISPDSANEIQQAINKGESFEFNSVPLAVGVMPLELVEGFEFNFDNAGHVKVNEIYRRARYHFGSSILKVVKGKDDEFSATHEPSSSDSQLENTELEKTAAALLANGITKEVAIVIIKSRLRQPSLESIKEIIKLRDIYNIEKVEMEEVIGEALADSLSRGDIESAKALRDYFNPSNYTLDWALEQGIVGALSSRYSYMEYVRRINETFNTSIEVKGRIRVQRALESKLKELLYESDSQDATYQLDHAINLCEVIKPNDETILEILKLPTTQKLGVVTPEVQSRFEYLALRLEYSFLTFGLAYFADLDTQRIVSSYVNDGNISEVENRASIFAFGHYKKIGAAASRRALGDVRMTEWHLVEQDFERVPKEQRDNAFYKSCWEKIKETNAWQEQAGAIEGFEVGAAKFGYQIMLRYCSACDLSRHDATIAMSSIVELATKLEVPQKQFINILEQVSRDNAQYESGTSYHQLNSLAQASYLAPKDLLLEVSSDPDLSQNKKLLEKIKYYQITENVFGSWDNLRSYLEFSYQVVHNKEAFKSITALRLNAKQAREDGAQGEASIYEARADYFEKIAYHPGGKVDIAALVQMFNDPESFLGLGDIHAPEETHDYKKPSNYTQIPYLGLAASDLVDALVTGKLDQIQTLPACSYIYEFPTQGLVTEKELASGEIKQLISKILGSRREGRAGILSEQATSKVFAELQRLVNESHAASGNQGKVNFVNQFLKGDYQVSAEVEASLRASLKTALEADARLDLNPQSYLVTIHKKSSPVSVLAGNDTECCMPFGSGKNNVYMFNPNCVQFTIQQLETDENGQHKAGRTVAQSVLTLDIDSRKSVPTLISEFQGRGHIADIVDEASLKDEARYVVCDSIETNQNFIADSQNVKELQDIYQDFFARYLNSLPEVLADGHRLVKDKVIVSESFKGPFGDKLDQVDNTFVPLAPMSYSDNTGEKSRVLKPSENTNITVSEIQSVTPSQEIVTEDRGRVSSLNYRDTLHVSVLEGKAYQDEQALVVSLHSIENTLIAKDISNELRGLDNLSFKYINREGKVKAYLVAYEGNVEQELLEQDDIVQLVPAGKAIYVYDFAALDRNSLEAGKVLVGFLEKYKFAYLDRGNAIPVYIDAREDTSYALIQKQLPTISKRLGVELRLVELGTYQKGNQTMHRVLITAQNTVIDSVELSSTHEKSQIDIINNQAIDITSLGRELGRTNIKQKGTVVYQYQGMALKLDALRIRTREDAENEIIQAKKAFRVLEKIDSIRAIRPIGIQEVVMPNGISNWCPVYEDYRQIEGIVEASKQVDDRGAIPEVLYRNMKAKQWAALKIAKDNGVAFPDQERNPDGWVSVGDPASEQAKVVIYDYGKPGSDYYFTKSFIEVEQDNRDSLSSTHEGVGFSEYVRPLRIYDVRIDHALAVDGAIKEYSEKLSSIRKLQKDAIQEIKQKSDGLIIQDSPAARMIRQAEELLARKSSALNRELGNYIKSNLENRFSLNIIQGMSVDEILSEHNRVSEALNKFNSEMVRLLTPPLFNEPQPLKTILKEIKQDIYEHRYQLSTQLQDAFNFRLNAFDTVFSSSSADYYINQYGRVVVFHKSPDKNKTDHVSRYDRAFALNYLDTENVRERKDSSEPIVFSPKEVGLERYILLVSDTNIENIEGNIVVRAADVHVSSKISRIIRLHSQDVNLDIHGTTTEGDDFGTDVVEDLSATHENELPEHIKQIIREQSQNISYSLEDVKFKTDYAEDGRLAQWKVEAGFREIQTLLVQSRPDAKTVERWFNELISVGGTEFSSNIVRLQSLLACEFPSTLFESRIFQDHNFTSPVSSLILAANIENILHHFSTKRDLEEYVRILRVFGCKEQFQSILERELTNEQRVGYLYALVNNLSERHQDFEKYYSELITLIQEPLAVEALDKTTKNKLLKEKLGKPNGWVEDMPDFVKKMQFDDPFQHFSLHEAYTETQNVLYKTIAQLKSEVKRLRRAGTDESEVLETIRQKFWHLNVLVEQVLTELGVEFESSNALGDAVVISGTSTKRNPTNEYARRLLKSENVRLVVSLQDLVLRGGAALFQSMSEGGGYIYLSFEDVIQYCIHENFGHERLHSIFNELTVRGAQGIFIGNVYNESGNKEIKGYAKKYSLQEVPCYIETIIARARRLESQLLEAREIDLALVNIELAEIKLMQAFARDINGNCKLLLDNANSTFDSQIIMRKDSKGNEHQLIFAQMSNAGVQVQFSLGGLDEFITKHHGLTPDSAEFNLKLNEIYFARINELRSFNKELLENTIKWEKLYTQASKDAAYRGDHQNAIALAHQLTSSIETFGKQVRDNWLVADSLSATHETGELIQSETLNTTSLLEQVLSRTGVELEAREQRQLRPSVKIIEVNADSPFAVKIEGESISITYSGSDETFSIQAKLSAAEFIYFKKFLNENSSNFDAGLSYQKEALINGVNYARLHAAFYGPDLSPQAAAQALVRYLKRENYPATNYGITESITESEHFKSLLKWGEALTQLADSLQPKYRDEKVNEAVAVELNKQSTQVYQEALEKLGSEALRTILEAGSVKDIDSILKDMAEQDRKKYVPVKLEISSAKGFLVDHEQRSVTYEFNIEVSKEGSLNIVQRRPSPLSRKSEVVSLRELVDKLEKATDVSGNGKTLWRNFSNNPISRVRFDEKQEFSATHETAHDFEKFIKNPTDLSHDQRQELLSSVANDDLLTWWYGEELENSRVLQALKAWDDLLQRNNLSELTRIRDRYVEVYQWILENGKIDWFKEIEVGKLNNYDSLAAFFNQFDKILTQRDRKKIADGPLNTKEINSIISAVAQASTTNKIAARLEKQLNKLERLNINHNLTQQEITAKIKLFSTLTAIVNKQYPDSVQREKLLEDIAYLLLDPVTSRFITDKNISSILTAFNQDAFEYFAGVAELRASKVKSVDKHLNGLVNILAEPDNTPSGFLSEIRVAVTILKSSNYYLHEISVSRSFMGHKLPQIAGADTEIDMVVSPIGPDGSILGYLAIEVKSSIKTLENSLRGAIYNHRVINANNQLLRLSKTCKYLQEKLGKSVLPCVVIDRDYGTQDAQSVVQLLDRMVSLDPNFTAPVLADKDLVITHRSVQHEEFSATHESSFPNFEFRNALDGSNYALAASSYQP
jgi:hypothetical protein